MQSKAIVADDHPLFRAALKQALTHSIGLDIAESDCLPQTFTLLEQQIETELLFLDLKMPGNQGLSGLSQIRIRYPDLLIIVVSAEEDTQLMLKAIELGASGYIPKSTPLAKIVEAVEHILDGEQWLPEGIEHVSEAPSDSDESDFAKRLELLTPQQFTVLQKMADGLLNKQIAYELGVKETTIKQHSSAILRKLGLNNRTQAGVLFKQVMAVGDTSY